MKIEDKQGSMYDLGESDEDEDIDNEDELIRYVFKFRHSTSENLVSKAFKVKIVDKSYSNVDYSYRTLTLIPDDDNLNDWNDNASIQSLVEESQPPSEESLKSLPGLVTERVGEGTNMLRSQNDTFKFIK